MGLTLIEKILAAHSGRDTVRPGEIIDLAIDARIARDFGGANVVRALESAGLGIDDPSRTFFTFDCNPTGSDQKYAANQQACRVFAADRGIRVFDIDSGVGTHVAVEQGLVWPGATLVSTDSHANIVGAIGAFGQGMGDADIAAAFAFGKVWFKVPGSVRVVFRGQPGPEATPKDLVLAALGRFGAEGLLGSAVELSGPAIDALDIDGRLTVASMATEMGAIIALMKPDDRAIAFCLERSGRDVPVIEADPEARYERSLEVDVEGLSPRVSRPGHPEDVVGVDELPPTRVDSVVIGSCTNGRMADMRDAADVLKGRTVAPGLVLKVVPSTDQIWRQCLVEGLIEVFKSAGALVGNAGCAGCAAGQIGQNGPGEVTVSTGNRNFSGKQGGGLVYLASPRTAAASAVAGVLTTAAQLTAGAVPSRPVRPVVVPAASPSIRVGGSARATRLRGRAWVIDRDSVDTDQIYHNQHLAEIDPAKMGRHAFGNLAGWEHFPAKVSPGDLLVTGANFGCGSSRQQAVTCFQTLGVAAILGRSFGAIYERNAINGGLPIVTLDWKPGDLETGDEIGVDLEHGLVANLSRGTQLSARPLSTVEMIIYQRGGLLVRG